MGQPFTTIAENPDGSLEFQIHIPTGEEGLEIVIGWEEGPASQVRDQLNDFLTLVDQKRTLEAMAAADSGGH